MFSNALQYEQSISKEKKWNLNGCDTWPSCQPHFILVNATDFHSRIPWHMIQVCVGDLAIAIKTSRKCLWVMASAQHCTTMHQWVCADVFGHQGWVGIPLTCSSVRVGWRGPSVRTAFSSISTWARVFTLHRGMCVLASQAIVAGSRHGWTAPQGRVCALPFKKKIFFIKPSSTRPSLHICCCSHPSFSTRHSFSARDGLVCLSCTLTLPTSYLDLKFLLVEFATISSLLFCIFIKWDKEELLQNTNRASRMTNTICWVCPRNCRTHMSSLTLWIMNAKIFCLDFRFSLPHTFAHPYMDCCFAKKR